MKIIIGIGHEDPNSNLDEAVYISKNANAFEKGMHPTILSPAAGK